MQFVNNMSFGAVMYKDPDGFHYKHPERSCTKCRKYPCLPKMDALKSNFAAYGCTMFDDVDVFELCADKK